MNFFQDIICINLDISKDRREHAEYFFKKLNISAKFLTVSKHPKGGMYGCFDSHIKILKDAFKRNLDNVLVFEDDFLPTDAYSYEKLLKAIEFMKSNKEWDVFHLGYSFIKDEFRGGIKTIFNGKYITDDIVKFNPMLTQSLCYSKKAIKKIVENYKEYIGVVHYDAFISNHLDFKNYCIIPMLFDQNFYFQHNNESIDLIEKCIRIAFPILAFTKINYRMTYIKYILNKYDVKKTVMIIITLYIILKSYKDLC